MTDESANGGAGDARERAKEHRADVSNSELPPGTEPARGDTTPDTQKYARAAETQPGGDVKEGEGHLAGSGWGNTGAGGSSIDKRKPEAKGDQG